MSIINDLIGNILNPEPKFYIYNNEYVFPLSATVTSNVDTQQQVVFSFTSLMSISYDKENTVPEYPLEEGGYSTDSTIVRAPTLTLVVNYTPYPTSLFDTDEMLRLKVKTILDELKTYADSVDLLTVSMQNAPLFDIYTDLKLYGCSYEQNPQQTGFYVQLKFKQMRFNSAEYGTLPKDKILNPEYSNTIDKGQNLPQTPSTSTVGQF